MGGFILENSDECAHSSNGARPGGARPGGARPSAGSLSGRVGADAGPADGPIATRLADHDRSGRGRPGRPGLPGVPGLADTTRLNCGFVVSETSDYSSGYKDQHPNYT